MTLTYKTNGVCSRSIFIEIDDATDIIKNVEFSGGCNGNTKGIAKLCVGMKVSDVCDRLKGIKCGFKGTSCPDQLSCALQEYLSNKQ